ncbi:MAG TPA: SpoIIE family protein phosphatase [Terriglobia bacterium]|nr:SpoIIE family protein phosphatase [Terriglobia bacterium]
MLTSILEALYREYRTRRGARFSLWVIAYGVALWLVGVVTSGAPSLLWYLFWVTFIPVIVYYVGRLIGFIRRRGLWRLRSRLVVIYIFIAFVPIALIVVLVGTGAFIVNGQFAAFLVALNLREHFDELQQLNRAVVHEAELTREKKPEALLDDLRTFYVTELGNHAASYPGLEITIRLGPLERAYRLDGTPLKTPVTVPPWFKEEEFAGIVVDQGELALRAIEHGRTPLGDLTVILSQASTPELLDLVGEGIGPVGIFIPQERGTAAAPPSPGPGGQLTNSQGERVDTNAVSSKSLQLPAPANMLDWRVFGAAVLDPVVWNSPTRTRMPVPTLLYASSRILTLNRQLLASLGDLSRIYVVGFEILSVLFLVVELIAIVIGYGLTRSMTTTVDRLYKATERVKVGDLSYRIGLPARDQLSALGEAFDTMTASVERLLRESEEKSRLESELEIAREVQTRLFPQNQPQVRGLELYGICNPARVVSGDYYDFLSLEENWVGLVLGDVSGKGISAALLMAAIQSALHAQFYDGHSSAGATQVVPISSAEIVRRLNRQLFESTPREKYATFFYGAYNGATRQLTYTNAGHLPPFFFHLGKVERLEAGGTVVGLFGNMTYDQAVVELAPGDTLFAFTDGVTEPENIYGEEFGEARLLEVVQEALGAPPEVLVEEVCRRVNDWTGRPELQDDMTVVVARAVP